jgi:hypothetical protein
MPEVRGGPMLAAAAPVRAEARSRAISGSKSAGGASPASGSVMIGHRIGVITAPDPDVGWVMVAVLDAGGGWVMVAVLDPDGGWRAAVAPGADCG